PRTGSKSAWRAQGAPIDAGFPDPVSLTACPYLSLDLLTSPTLPNLAAASRGDFARNSVDAAFGHEGPGDACCSIRQCHGGHERWLSCHHACEPRALWRSLAQGPPHDCDGTADQKPPQVSLAHLGR